MAPDSCGERVLVVSSPYKSHTLSVATIQLGQHHLKPFALTLGPSSGNTTADLGQNSTPPPLSRVVLQPCSFDTRCTGRVGRSVRISIVHLYTLVIRLQGSCFSGQHGETVERSFPIVSRHSADNNAWIELTDGRQRYSPTRGDTGVSKRRISDNEGSQSKMWAVPCYAVRCHEHMNTSIKMCVCIVRVGVQMVLPVGSEKSVYSNERIESELERVYSSL